MTHPRGERHLHEGQTAIVQKYRLPATMGSYKKRLSFLLDIVANNILAFLF